ncbi:MAG: SDR family NAD(P)-dependent oxidoreductase [Polyangiaceae bacterium]|nr:SDR family NAD(P)-dependent oxidoreductase [Polyangiaceae bacterium]
MKRIVLLGATRGMGRELGRQFAGEGAELFLLGRSLEELAKTATDFKERAGGDAKVGSAYCDLEDPASFAPALQAAQDGLGTIDAIIVTAGLFATQEKLEADLDLTQRLLTVNFALTVTFCEQARSLLLAQGGGALCVFSSVAGDRGRKPVVLYGASKAGLSAYLEGLDHKYRDQGLITLCVKPGFVRTGMTTGLKEPPFAGDPEAVAADVRRALEKKKAVVYAPGMWRWVMFIIRRLPRFVMRKVGF